ncbi:CCR4-NOT transcription complex subunit 4 [Lucilia cuprina]|nr:CCR4-NOT transcription complex subunit 4 [Lucilia cuprina]
MNNLNNSVDEPVECPLCMEPLEVDDLNFFPCTCGYQICRFCWHRIRTDENELCPACRKEYPENPADFKPLTQEEMIAFKSQKRQRDQQRKQKITENRKHLANVRVVQKNLVFVVGLPPRLADADILKKHEYFGKYGKIHKVVINPSTAYAGVQGPSASAYVTYVHNSDALRAIQSVNNIMIDGRLIKTSLGTTKYCSHFMKNQQCPKGDCMYLHELGDPEASFTKEEMHQGKHQEYEKRLHDVLIASSGNSTSGCGVSTGSTSSLINVKNVESCKMSGVISSIPTSSSVSTNNVISSVLGSAPQKEAWPSLSISPVNQKEPSSNNGNKNKKERTKQDKNKSEKNSKIKNKNNNNSVSNPLHKEIDLPAIISNSSLESSTANNNSLAEPTSKSKVDKNTDRNQSNMSNRSNTKKELTSSTIVENEIKEFGKHSKTATTKSIHSDGNNDGYICKTRNDNNITKTDSQRSLSSSSNSSSSCIVTTSENNSIINESLSGKSSPISLNENNLNDECSKSPIKYKRTQASSSELDTNQDSNADENNLSKNCSKPYGYVENLFVDNEVPKHNNNIEQNNLCLNESPDNNRLEKIHFNESLLKESEEDNSITDAMSKLNLFDENSFFSSTSGILQQTMPLKLKQNEETIPNQLSTAPNLPDLINEWEEALKNVMIKSNKQMEEKLLHNLHQQQIQSHIKHQEDVHRHHEIQSRNNILSSLNFQTGSNNYLTSSDLSRQTSYLQYQQQQQQSNESSNDNVLQSSLFGTNMSKFFDFHKHQQQQKLQQHCLQMNGPNNVNGGVNENLHIRPILENNRLNSQLVDPNCILTSQQQQKQKLFGKIDQMLCHQTLQQHPNQQIGSVQTQQNQFIQNSTGDDDLGFDPFIETQKALAELIENEEEQQNVATNLINHKQTNNIHQPHQQQMMEYMQRARMPPPGFNHVNNFNGYGVVPRIQNSKVMPFMNLSNNYTAPTGQHIQHQQQLQIPSNAWGTHLGNFQQHINEAQIRQVNSNQIPSGGNQKGYTGNDWTAMDPAILSFRQFSFPHQTQVTPQMQPQQQEMFLQQLAQQQQQPVTTSKWRKCWNA